MLDKLLIFWDCVFKRALLIWSGVIISGKFTISSFLIGLCAAVPKNLCFIIDIRFSNLCIFSRFRIVFTIARELSFSSIFSDFVFGFNVDFFECIRDCFSNFGFVFDFNLDIFGNIGGFCFSANLFGCNLGFFLDRTSRCCFTDFLTCLGDIDGTSGLDCFGDTDGFFC